MLVWHVLSITAALFVPAWLLCRWLEYREARAGSVRPVAVRLRAERCEYEIQKTAISVIAEIDLRNSGRWEVKTSGRGQILVNGKIGTGYTGYQWFNFNGVIPAGAAATFEMEFGRMDWPTSDTLIDGFLYYDLTFQILRKRAHTSQKTATKIAIDGKIDAKNVLGPIDCKIDIGPDLYAE